MDNKAVVKTKKKKGLSSKGWLVSFTAFLLLIAVLWGSINIYLDPFSVFGTENSHTWWSYGETLNPRASKITYLDKHYEEFDSYVLGASSCSGWSVPLLNKYLDARFYNLINYGMDSSEMKMLADYIIENYIVKNLFVSLYIGSAVTNSEYEQTLTYSNNYKVNGSSALKYYSKYLFAPLSNAFTKLEKEKTDSYIPAAHDCFYAPTGAYDKRLRDIEPIGDLSEYVSRSAYSVFTDYPAWAEEAPYIDEMAASLAYIRDLCEEKGINLIVTLIPCYQGNINQYDPALVEYFRTSIKNAAGDQFYDFMLCDGCDDPRFFYDTYHVRNSLCDLCLKEIFEGQTVYAGDELKLPVLMYHSVNENGNEYSIKPEVFEAHIKAVLKAGYTPVSCSEVLAWAKGEGQLPEKPIMITFDDGYENNYTNAFPILKKYNAKAAIFAIGGSVGRDIYVDGKPMTPHFDLKQAAEMEESGLVEVQSHSFRMHQVEGRDEEPVRKGVSRLEGESEASYAQALRNDIRTYKEEVKDVFALSYPEGQYSTLSEIIFAEEGISMTFCSEEKTNVIIRGLPQSLRLLGRLDADSLSSSELLEKIN